ncbi:hypothetical protein MLD38_019975 [Melastoma candidum]|uniref:Uncharacterized protein n=1 Tax=Melastoma candidum TaxID=119954 RepID=A0ACB9QJG0_9MYRT|nr:hypothetical protein MLD38_019975 [Melastoma candidum]
MDLRRSASPVYARQWSADISSTGSSSPAMSPLHPHSRLPQGTVKRAQNVAAKAAAQRLAQVMASQTTEDDEDDDDADMGFKFRVPAVPVSSYSTNLNNSQNSTSATTAPPRNSLSRPQRSPSPALGWNFVDHGMSARSTSAERSSMSVRSNALVPPSKSSLKTPVSIPPIEPSIARNRLSLRFTSEIDQTKVKDLGDQREASALRDELDMLQEENEILLEKLRQAEEKRQEAEAKARDFEKQVVALGEGVSLEAKWVLRKEAALRQREAALKSASQMKDVKDENIVALRSEIQAIKDDAAACAKQLREKEAEVKALRSMTHRMILTQEELEEVVLKRCWLARYWGLAVQHGICADIATSQYEHWSSLAPLPLEVVVSAGQKAKEEGGNKKGHELDNSKPVRDASDLTGEGNIESMLSVEMALRELASLKVEDAVVLALARLRRPTLVQTDASYAKAQVDTKLVEAFELSGEEAEDVLFKQAWLTYFWRRALVHGVEDDIAEERLQFWISRSGHSPSCHDVVDVERGLLELRKLSIEQQLWEASRREVVDQPSLFSKANNNNSNTGIDAELDLD